MVKSTSMMNNVAEICAEHRKRIYGQDAKAKDFKDSFIINYCIANFNGKPEDLMRDEITKLDQQGKTSKSVNFRSDCYEKICTYSKLLNVPESEICRRILYFMLGADIDNTNENVQLAALKSKVALLQTQIEASMQTLGEIMKEIDSIEGRIFYGEE
jgi:hypothetical protein